MSKVLLLIFIIFVVGVWARSSCSSCGQECVSACGTRYFRTCCFNYLRKKRITPLVKMQAHNNQLPATIPRLHDLPWAEDEALFELFDDRTD